ncbi:trypsin-like peptidase domain-containing protein [Spirillospora sp. NPDC050679]
MTELLDGDEPLIPADSSWAAMVCGSADGEGWLGSAVLIDGRRLLTCDHVLGGEQWWVEFPKAAEHDERRYRVAGVVRAPRYDLALLTLEEEPLGVTPAPLRHTPPIGLVKRSWWTFGYPLGEPPHGNDAHGRVGAELGRGFVRLDSGDGVRYALRSGFSGSGVWSPEYQAVVAVTVEASSEGDGMAVTLHRAIACFPDAKLERLTSWAAGDADEAARSSWKVERPAQGWSLRNDLETTRHWSPRARGVSVDSEGGHRFRGRRNALTRMVGWLDGRRADRRVLVVTGSPGVGKSAVLGRIVTTADPVLRERLPADDDGVRASPNSVQCAVHAKGKTAHEIAVEIARAASLPLPELLEDLVPAMHAELTGRPRRFNIIIDALDEAASPVHARRAVIGLILPLAQTCADVGVRVIVGTRPHDDDGELLKAFGQAHVLVDLDRPEYFALEDLTAYALATLQLRGAERPGNPYAARAVAGPVAEGIAKRSKMNFLVAGLVARSHGLYDTEPVDPRTLTFVGSVDHALRDYLKRVPAVHGVSATRLLTALAFAQAPGLSIQLWLTAVRALTSVTLTPQELRTFAKSSAANFLVESTREQSFRLFHQALNDVLLNDHGQVIPNTESQRAIAAAFQEHGQAIGWENAPDYLLRSLPDHAAAGRCLDRLLEDTGFLLHAELSRVLSVKYSATGTKAQDCVRVLDLTPQAREAAPLERLALLALTEAMENLGRRFQEAARTAPASCRPTWAACQARLEVARLEGHTDVVEAVCAIPSPDGPALLATASRDTSVRIWDPHTVTVKHTLTGHTGAVKAMCTIPSPDGHVLLATAGQDGKIRIWDPYVGALQSTVGRLPSQVTSLCASVLPDGRVLLTTTGDGVKAQIQDVQSGAVRHTLVHARRESSVSGQVHTVCALPGFDPPLLATVGHDGTAQVWDPQTGAKRHVLEDVKEVTNHFGGTSLEVNGMTAACALPMKDGRHLLATAHEDHSVRVWDPRSGTLVSTFTELTEPVKVICAVPAPGGGSLLATAHGDHSVHIWDPADVTTRHALTGHTDTVSAMCAIPTPDGRPILATVSQDRTDRTDRTVRIWDPDNKAVQRTGAHTGRARAVQALTTADGRLLLAVADRTVEIWDPEAGTAPQVRADSMGVVGPVRQGMLCALPTADGDTLLVTIGHGAPGAKSGASRGLPTPRIRDPLSGESIRALTGRGRFRRRVGDLDAASAVCVLPMADGRPLLATSHADRSLRIWEPATGALLRTVVHAHPQHSMCGLPVAGGGGLVAAANQNIVRIWDVLPRPDEQLRGWGRRHKTLSLPPRHILTAHTGTVNSMCAVPSPDGDALLATASNDGTARIWDPRSGEPLHVLTGHVDAVNAVCALPGPGGGHLVTASRDRTVRVWNLDGSLRTVLHVHHEGLALSALPSGFVIGLNAGTVVLDADFR